MKYDNLYIIGGEDTKYLNEIDKTSNIIFLDKEQEGFENRFSIIRSFQEQQSFLREKWITLQKEVFKKIQPYIDQDDDFRYVLSGLFFEASPNKTNSMYQFFKFYLIIDYIKKQNIKNIFLVNVSEDAKTFFNLNIKNFFSSIKIITIKKKKLSLKNSIKNLTKKYLLSTLLNSLIIEYKKNKQKPSLQKSWSSKVVFSYYYPGGHSFNNGFSSKYFEDVSSLLNKEYNWLFLYVGNLNKLREESGLIKDNVNSFGFLDAYFSLTDFQKITLKFLKIRKKLKSIKLKNLFIFEEVDYFCFTKSDWHTSVSSLLLNLLIFEKKISNFFAVNPQINEFVYLMEFQPWELMVNKVAQKYGVKTKGVIHSVVRPNVMNYYHSKKIHPYLCMPSYVGVNSDFSRSLMIKNGFKVDQILKIEAQRFNYILQNKSKINSDKSRLRKTILIITSIIHNETKELLEFFASVNIKFEKVYIKEHHLFKVEPIIKSSIKNFPSFEIFNGTIADAFELSDIVFTANGSSVLLESVVNKKETISVISLSSLPIPAIDKASNLHFVNDTNSLSKILKKLTEMPVDKVINNESSNYLYLNDELSLWQDFLNK